MPFLQSSRKDFFASGGRLREPVQPLIGPGMGRRSCRRIATVSSPWTSASSGNRRKYRPSRFRFGLTVMALLPLPMVSVSVRYFGSAIHRRSEKIQEQLAKGAKR